MERTGIWPPEGAQNLHEVPLEWSKGSPRSYPHQKRPIVDTEWSRDDQELWDQTVQEEKNGNLDGPYSPEQLEKQVGK